LKFDCLAICGGTPAMRRPPSGTVLHLAADEGENGGPGPCQASIKLEEVSNVFVKRASAAPFDLPDHTRLSPDRSDPPLARGLPEHPRALRRSPGYLSSQHGGSGGLMTGQNRTMSHALQFHISRMQRW